jgi:hypothetical protein
MEFFGVCNFFVQTRYALFGQASRQLELRVQPLSLSRSFISHSHFKLARIIDKPPAIPPHLSSVQVRLRESVLSRKFSER